MNDRELLNEAYRTLQTAKHCGEGKMQNELVVELISVIQQEWQKQDERVSVAMYNRNRPVKDHVTKVTQFTPQACDALDIKEIERRRGLEIGPDGTVTDLK